MSLVSTDQWESLERWSPSVFLFAGIVRFVLAVLQLTPAFIAISFEEPPAEFVLLSVAAVGYVALFVGLSGLYPSLSDRTPRVALSGLSVSVIGAVAAVVFLVYTVAAWLAGPAITFVRPTVVIVILLEILAAGVVGIASLRTAPFRVVGGLLLVFGILRLGKEWMLVTMDFGHSSPYFNFVFFLLFGIVMLAIWYYLKG